MEIEDYTINEDEELTFFVPTENYLAIYDFLTKNGIHVGGHHDPARSTCKMFTNASKQSVVEVLRGYSS